MPLPRIAITMGDVNGIGPELVAKLYARHQPWRWCRPIVYGSESALDSVRSLTDPLPPVVKIATLADVPETPDSLILFDAGSNAPAPQPGILNPAAGASAVTWIESAAKSCTAGLLDGMVTCPINKECIRQAGCSYIGHTEMVADLSGAEDYRMCLFAGNMRIVHLTGHVSLRDALDFVRTDRIVRSAEIANTALRRMGIAAPRVGVAGLNPHAGEAGAFGREEIEEIAPAVELCRRAGIDCHGPVSPDTIFRKMQDGEFDVVIAMYHDQGHIPLKLIAMDEGVNITLGIPIVRTSVDHGTAFDIAGRGIAREDSLVSALKLAAALAGDPA